MSKGTQLSRRELFTSWRKRLTESAPAPEENAEELTKKQIKSLARDNAFKLMEKGDLDDAIEAFRSYIRQELDDDEARMALGACLYDKRQLIQAKVEFERVLRIRKNDSLASLYLALTLLRREKYDKTLQLLTTLADMDADPLLVSLTDARNTLETEGPAAMCSVLTVLEKTLANETLRLA